METFGDTRSMESLRNKNRGNRKKEKDRLSDFIFGHSCYTLLSSVVLEYHPLVRELCGDVPLRSYVF